jgi:hypothetical protein
MGELGKSILDLGIACGDLIAVKQAFPDCEVLSVAA